MKKMEIIIKKLVVFILIIALFVGEVPANVYADSLNQGPELATDEIVNRDRDESDASIQEESSTTMSQDESVTESIDEEENSVPSQNESISTQVQDNSEASSSQETTDSDQVLKDDTSSMPTQDEPKRDENSGSSDSEKKTIEASSGTTKKDNTSETKTDVVKREISDEITVSISASKTIISGKATAILTPSLSGSVEKVVYSWSGPNYVSINMSNSGVATVATVPGKKGGIADLTVTAEYTIKTDNDTETKKTTATCQLTVNTARAVNFSYDVTDHAGNIIKNTSNATVQDTLSLNLTAAEGAVEDDGDASKYQYQWQIGQVIEGGTNISFSNIENAIEAKYVPKKRGIYRVHVTRAKSSKNYRIRYDGYSENITVTPIPIKLNWTADSKIFDGSSSIVYAGTLTAVRTDGTPINTLGLTYDTKLELPSADANVYELPAPTVSGYSADEYEIVDSGKIQITVTPVDVNVWLEIGNLDKNFDNSDTIEEIREIPYTIKYTDESSNEDSIGYLKVVCDNDVSLTTALLKYENVGVVSEDTIVKVLLKNPDEIHLVSSDESCQVENYTAHYYLSNEDGEDTAVIRRVTVSETDVLTLKGGFLVDGARWIRKTDDGATVTAIANEGYLLSDEVGGEYKQSVEAIVSDNGLTVYVKLSNGDIAEIVMDSVKMDSEAPKMTRDGAAIFKNKEYVNTYTITDDASGVKDVYFVFSETNDQPVFDKDTWNKMDPVENEDGTFGVTVKVPSRGYIYFYFEDNVGNSVTGRDALLIVEDGLPELEVAVEGEGLSDKQTVLISANDTPEDYYSGIKEIMYKLFDASGNDVTDNSIIEIKDSGIADVSVDTTLNCIVQNSAPTTIDDVEIYHSLSAELSVSGENLDGKYTLQFFAKDFCGNESTKTEVELLFDTTKPVVDIQMNGGKRVEKEETASYYYNGAWMKDNSSDKIIINYADTNLASGGIYSATLKGAEFSLTKQLDVEGEKTTGAIVFTKEELESIDDGKYTIAVAAKDIFGNETDIIDAESTGVEINQKEAAFIYDTTPPVVKKISTPVDDNSTRYCYGSTIYYSTSPTTTVIIEDENIGQDSFETNYKGAIIAKQNREITVIFSGLQAGKTYAPYTIKATDYAGNGLVFSDTISISENVSRVNDKLSWTNTNEGQIESKYYRYSYGYGDDRKKPFVTIQYYLNSGGVQEKLNKSFDYSEESTAYYCGDIDVNINVNNIYNIDNLKTLFVTTDYTSIEGVTDSTTLALSDLPYIAKDNSFSFNITLKEEGSYKIRLKGADLSQQNIELHEYSPSSNNKVRTGVIGLEKEYSSLYTLVRDTTSPEAMVIYEFSDDQEPVNSQLSTVHGNRYYFNTSFLAKFIVKEVNLGKNLETIILKKAENSEADKYEKVEFDEERDFKKIINGSFNATDQQALLTDTVNNDGVYKYIISGTDRAGNPLRLCSDVYFDMTNESTIDEQKTYTTYPVVLDTVAPIATVNVYDKKGDDKTLFYSKQTTIEDADQDVENIISQFIKGKSAYITVTVTDEKSPVQVAGNINLKNNTNTVTITGSEVDDNGLCIESDIVKTEQIFTISDFVARDLAGNSTNMKANAADSVKIYVDASQPQSDKYEPAIIVTASIPDATYSNEGKPLFNGNSGNDIPFNLIVTEPYGTETGVAEADLASSGINRISYKLFEVDSKGKKSTELIGTTAIYSYDGVIRTQYAKENAISIPVGYNRNNLILEVTAQDNAGNKNIYDYAFGIDKTAPTITVTYENNAAVNDKFFKNTRKATITVTERNFIADDFGINITATKNGSNASNAGQYAVSEWSERRQNKKIVNGDGDTWVKTVEFIGDGDYTFEIDSSAKDAAGNMAVVTYDGVATNEFTIDRTPPTAELMMNGTADTDNKYYYNASNADIVINFSDGGVNLYRNIKGVEYSASIGNKLHKAVDLSAENTENSNASITFSADEIAQLQDGEYTIEIVARDAAGNEATSLLKSSKGAVIEGMTGTFVLDATAPAVTLIETATTNTSSDIYTDNKLYSDTNSVYYNQKVTVTIAVTDEYVNVNDFGGSVISIVNGKQSEILPTSVTKKNPGIVFQYALDKETAYHSLSIFGHDKAGNQIVLDKEYSHVQIVDDMKESLVLTEAEEELKTVELVHGKVIDTESPNVFITYSSDAKANLYRGETEKKTSAYYNKDISVGIRFIDNYELDGEKLRAGREDKHEVDPFTISATVNEYVYSDGTLFDTEGRRSYSAYGTDRALNPIIVYEQIPLTPKNSEVKYEKFGTELTKDKTGSVYEAKYELILDKTHPVYTLDIHSDGAKNKNISVQGKRYFFNNSYTATVKVTDTNFDKERVFVKSGSVVSGSYNSATEIIKEFKTVVSGTDSGLYSETVSNNGVYRYAIFGSDKAGNAVISSDNTNIETTDPSLVNAASEAENGSEERTADISYHVVIDTIAPKGTYIAKSNGKDVYKMNSEGSVSGAYPFSKKDSADYSFIVDSSERTPVRIEYTIDAAPKSKSKKVDTGDYVYARSVKGSQNGRQQFKLTEWTMTDLAGNVTKTSSKNYIYLDVDKPSTDYLAPTASVSVTKAKSDSRGGKGQPLYAGDVNVKVVVDDPFANESSSGLADVSFEVFINGTKIDGDTIKLHTKNKNQHSENYPDEKLSYHIEQTIPIKASSHNYNDIQVVVNATDNSGNVATPARLAFGIDTTAPTISVKYDNDNAQNGKYFKANRTATITVTERNFDASKMSIKTQSGNISGWSHTSGRSANGDDDTWTATILYSSDGVYTLDVSGADTLGHAASSISYNGVAPKEFVIDKTAPVVSITYDNNDVQNDKYYKADRTATITVTDVNYNGTNDISISATAGGVAPGISFIGKSASLPFTSDGVYLIKGTVTDMAGNVSAVFTEPEFVIDKTNPELKIEGVKDLSANRESLNVVLTMLDVNLNEDSVVAELTGTNNGNIDISGKKSFVEGGIQYALDVIEMDDYYKLVFTGVDLAGNEVSETISFSENKNGTTFKFEQEDDLVNGYAKEAFIPSFVLTNVDEVTILSVTVNGKEVDYNYRNNRLTLADEVSNDGKYVITIDTRDAAGNMSFYEGEFFFDGTKPIILQEGLTVYDDGSYQYYYGDKFILKVMHDFEDDEFVEIKVNNKVLGKDEYIINDDGSVTLMIDEYQRYKVYVKVTDTAGNTVDTTWKFEVTRNPVKLMYNNHRPVFIILLILLILLIILILLYIKKKYDERKDQERKAVKEKKKQEASAERRR